MNVGTRANQQYAVRFDSLGHAEVTVPGRNAVVGSGETIGIQSGTQQTLFTVRRLGAGPSTVTFAAVDACDE